MPGATLTYPLSDVIKEPQQFMLLGDAAASPPTPAFSENDGLRKIERRVIADQIRRTDESWGYLNRLPQSAQDMALLAAFAWKQRESRDAMHGFATMTDDRFVTAYLEALKRNGLNAPARIAQSAIDVFPPEATSQPDRFRRATDASDTLTAGSIETRLDRLAAEMKPQIPAIFRRATEIVRADPALRSLYEKKRANRHPSRKRAWLTAALEACAPDWQLAAVTGDPFADLPPAQHDFLLLSLFQREFYIGGMAKFFAEPTGAVAPEAELALRKYGLILAADELSKGMQLYGTPYPRDLADRRAVERGFSAEQEDWLYSGDGRNVEIVDSLPAAVNALAVSSSLMPELAGAQG